MANRLPIVNYAQGTPAQQLALLEFQVDRSAPNPPTDGLFNQLVAVPEALRRVGKVGAFARTLTSLPAAEREAAIVRTTAIEGYEYETTVHSGIMKTNGADDATVAAAVSGDLNKLSGGFRASVGLASAMASGSGQVSQETFDAVKAAFGDQGAVEMATVIGYYLMLCRLWKVLDA